MMALGKDGIVNDNIIDELLSKREIVDRLVAFEVHVRSNDKAAIMSALSDLLMALAESR